MFRFAFIVRHGFRVGLSTFASGASRVMLGIITYVLRTTEPERLKDLPEVIEMACGRDEI